MHSRGPDGYGIYCTDEAALLHTRLAIIDPEGGSQPMKLHWKGETYVISYNGELYNTMQLRRKLETLGHSFQSRSDTEVVLRAYAQWGKKAFLSDQCKEIEENNRMGKTRDLFKIIRDAKGTFHAKMG